MKAEFTKTQREIVLSRKAPGVSMSKIGREISVEKIPYSSTLGASPFEPEYLTILSYATTQGWTLPSPPVQVNQNFLLSNLKVSGIWALLDVFYVFRSNGDSNFARINWKNPGTHLASLGDTVWSSMFGAKRIGNNAPGITVPTFTGSLMDPTDSSIGGAYFNDGALNTKYDLFGFGGGPPIRLLVSAFGTSFATFPVLSSEIAIQNANVRSPGFLHFRRKTNTAIFKNGVQSGSAIIETPPASFLAIPISMLSNLGQGEAANVVAECLFAGKSLEGLEASFYNHWNNYKISI